MLRDPELDAGDVQMQYLATRPEFESVAPLFRKALIRLARDARDPR
jgi:hypothetical protein